MYTVITDTEDEIKVFDLKEEAESYCRNRKAYYKEITKEDSIYKKYVERN